MTATIRERLPRIALRAFDKARREGKAETHDVIVPSGRGYWICPCGHPMRAVGRSVLVASREHETWMLSRDRLWT